MSINNFEPIEKTDQLKTRYQLMLVCTIVLAVYYISMFSEMSLLDDRDAINGFFNNHNFDLKAVFFPRTNEGGYYRPLIGLMYYLDGILWFFNSTIMHFENILIHLANTILVFYIGQKLCKRKTSAPSLLPFWGAAVFSVHPICTETVNWISGRTDSLACLFVLFALLLLIISQEKGKWFLLAAYASAFVGALAKETALGFFPASIFLLLSMAKEDPATGNPFSKSRGWLMFIAYLASALFVALVFMNYYLVVVIGIVYLAHSHGIFGSSRVAGSDAKRMRHIILFMIACLLFVGVFWGLRKIAFVSDISKISDTLKVMKADMNYTIELFMGAAGFYAKKFFIPTPLNIAIREVDPLYELLGVFCFMGCISFIRLRRFESALVISGFLLLAPAFVISFGTIAWTAYAERYVYIPAAFWILSCVCGIQSISHEIRDRQWRYFRTAAVTSVVLFGIITFHRNTVWGTNVSLFRDSVEKSPEFKNVRGIYMTALYENKMYDEAEKQYLLSEKLYSIKYDEQYDLFYAKLLTTTNRYEKAGVLLEKIEKKTRNKSIKVYEAMSEYYGMCEDKTSSIEDKKIFISKKLYALQQHYNLSKSPYTLYRLGLTNLSLGDVSTAKSFFIRAQDHLEKNDPLQAAIRSYVK